MRIVFLSTGHPEADIYPEGGGIQYEIQGVAESLASLGHEIHIIARSVAIDGSEYKGIKYYQVVPVRRDEILSVMNFGRNAVGHIQEINPDILYLSERFSAAFASLLSVPKVFALHNYDALRLYWRFALGYNAANLVVFPLKHGLEQTVMRRCQGIIAPTESWLHYLRRSGLDGGTVIGHGLRLEAYEDRGENGFLLFAGRLNRVKGLDVLLRALPHLGIANSLNLLVVGKGPSEFEYRQMVRRLDLDDRVHFLGYVAKPRLLSLMATCTALILPSRWESFGIVAAEGLACGKPVIASDIPGPRDFIEHRKNGLLFPAEDAKSLSTCLSEVLHDGEFRRRLGAEARRRAFEAFPFERIALDHEKFYRQVLANGRSV